MCDGPYIPGTIPIAREKEATRYQFNGEMLRLSDIAVLTGIPTNTLRTRLASGKTLEQATANTDYRGSCYKKPRKCMAQKYSYRGEMLTLKEIGEKTGISLATIYSRYYSGWTIDELGEPLKHRKEKKND